jgi:hypothetical protein
MNEKKTSPQKPEEKRTPKLFMSRFFRFLTIRLLALMTLILMPAHIASAASGYLKPNPICDRLGKKTPGGIQASQGAHMFCFGPQASGPARPRTQSITGRGSPTNVDAANPAEDVTPAGVQSFGQSEVSIAASGSYVVEAWNDATGLFAPCPSPNN